MPIPQVNRPREALRSSFLDGLHTYGQTLRDFLSGQSLSHPRTVWLIDDTVPSDAIAADPDLQRTGCRSRWKSQRPNMDGRCIQACGIHRQLRPQFSCFTTEGHGQTGVLPKPRENSERLFSKLSAIDELTYVDVLLLKDNLLKPVPFERILEQISYLPRVTYRSLLGQ